MTPNQLVAFNLWRARTLLGLTQEQAAERLEPYLGERWSKRVFSAAERSMDGKRIRQFTADDLVAFAAGFDLPVWFFFATPFEDGAVAARNAEKGATARELAELAAVSDRHQRRIEELQQQRLAEHMKELAELGIELPPHPSDERGEQ